MIRIEKQKIKVIQLWRCQLYQ